MAGLHPHDQDRRLRPEPATLAQDHHSRRLPARRRFLARWRLHGPRFRPALLWFRADRLPACADRCSAPRSGAPGGPGGVRKWGCGGETMGEPWGCWGRVPRWGLPRPPASATFGGGRPPKGVFAGRRDNGCGRRPHNGRTIRMVAVRMLFGGYTVACRVSVDIHPRGQVSTLTRRCTRLPGRLDPAGAVLAGARGLWPRELKDIRARPEPLSTATEVQVTEQPYSRAVPIPQVGRAETARLWRFSHALGSCCSLFCSCRTLVQLSILVDPPSSDTRPGRFVSWAKRRLSRHPSCFCGGASKE